MSSPTLGQKAFEVLNRRSKMKLTDKVSLLHEFLRSDLAGFTNSATHTEMKDLQSSVKVSRKSSWDQVYCATKLADIYSAYKVHRANPVRCTRGRPGGGTFSFFVKLEGVLDLLIAEFESEKEVEVERDRRRQEKAAKRYVNAKVRSQDDIDWDEKKQEAEPCPACSHYYTMAIETWGEVDEANEALRAEHRKLMVDYDGLSVAKKKERKKPAKKKTKTQTVACYCFRMNCLLQASGGTCPSCINMHIAGESSFVMENGRRNCTCDICSCSCCVTFPRNRRYEVALALQTKVGKDVIDVDSPSNTVSMLGDCIMSGIKNGVVLARQGKPHGTDEEISCDTSAYALQTLLGSTQFRNAKAVKDLQTAIGGIPKMVGGKDIHTLRREKKLGQELLAQQNERFIRNKLSKGKIVKPSPHTLCTPVGIVDNDLLAPIVVSDMDGSGMGRAQLPTPKNLYTGGHLNSSSAVGRRNRIRRSSLKTKYDKSACEDDKKVASKLVAITKSHQSPGKDARVHQFIEDSIAMGLDTGDAKAMMIAELGNDV